MQQSNQDSTKNSYIYSLFIHLCQISQALTQGFLWGYMDWLIFLPIIEGFLPALLLTPAIVLFSIAQIFLPVFLTLSLYDAIVRDIYTTDPSSIKQPKWYKALHLLNGFYNTIKSGRGIMVLYTIGSYFHSLIGGLLFSFTYLNLLVIQLQLSLDRAKKEPFQLELNPLHLLFSLLRIIVTSVKMYTLFCLAFSVTSKSRVSYIIVPIIIIVGAFSQIIKHKKPNKTSPQLASTIPSLWDRALTHAACAIMWTCSITYTLFSTHTLTNGFFLIPMVARSLPLSLTSPYNYLPWIKKILNLSLCYSFSQINHRYVASGASILKNHIYKASQDISHYIHPQHPDANDHIEMTSLPHKGPTTP